MLDFEANRLFRWERGCLVGKSFWRETVSLPLFYQFCPTDRTLDLGVFYSTEGDLTRQESLQWSGSPEGIGGADSCSGRSILTTLCSLLETIHLLRRTDRLSLFRDLRCIYDHIPHTCSANTPRANTCASPITNPAFPFRGHLDHHRSDRGILHFLNSGISDGRGDESTLRLYAYR